MAELPDPVARLDRYLATVTIAHESIADLHDDVAAQSRSDEATRGLLREAGRIAAIEAPDVLREASRLRDRWSEQDLLDPGAAAETRRLVAAELDRVLPELSRIRRRQNEIGQEFRRLLEV